MTGSVSGRTSYVVAGEDAGHSKLDKVRCASVMVWACPLASHDFVMQARSNSIPVIDEDGLLELIKTRPTPTRKTTQKKTVAPIKKSVAAPVKSASCGPIFNVCSSVAVAAGCPDSSAVLIGSPSTSKGVTREVVGNKEDKEDATSRGKIE